MRKKTSKTFLADQAIDHNSYNFDKMGIGDVISIHAYDLTTGFKNFREQAGRALSRGFNLEPILKSETKRTNMYYFRIEKILERSIITLNND